MGHLIPVMTPAAGDRLQRFVGDRARFVLKDPTGKRPGPGWSARLRTNLGRANRLRQEIIQARAKGVAFAGSSWRDLPMSPDDDGWSLELPLAETGYFQAKPFLLDPKGWQAWPEGPNVGISVHPDAYRTANTLYCAFPRMFGNGKTSIRTPGEQWENQFRAWDESGFTVIPPSGKLRDLAACLPHIIETLGCRILHLLPVSPTPTTYARFGRFGSPYAALDLTAIDPALVVFDRRTTGVDQFCELTYAAHLLGGRVFLDIVINHTGWGSRLQENHPEFFLKQPDGAFASPGAWGNTWEDLVELKHESAALWDRLAEMFLTWCRRGVDGFRCDAGYKVPVPAWQYIIARVQLEFPDTVFLLEGLGGAWETTEILLTEGGMQWAYSELFQNYSGRDVASYLDYSIRQSSRVGLYVHYSETHDNERLAAQRASGIRLDDRATTGRAWSLLRNRLCALTSTSGGFGFTCGVEWLAPEKIKVHGASGMAWGGADNIVSEITQLNRLLSEHPCFFDGARLTRLSGPDSPVYALLRESFDSQDFALVLVNTELTAPGTLTLAASGFKQPLSSFQFDLLGQPLPESKTGKAGEVAFVLAPGAVYCLSPSAQPVGMNGEAYRRARAQAAWAIQMVCEALRVREIGHYGWRTLASLAGGSPASFLGALSCLDPESARTDLVAAIQAAMQTPAFPKVVRWTLTDCRRITPVPPGHWLLVEDAVPFRATLDLGPGQTEERVRHAQSIAAENSYVASFPPRAEAADATLSLERYAPENRRVSAAVRYLPSNPPSEPGARGWKNTDIVLLTNGRGGMARLCVDLGRIQSKYDCVVGANLHPSLPVDRHIFAKRIRVWVNADGFISPLDANNLNGFNPGPPATWQFVANAGDGRTVEIAMQVEMAEGCNTTLFRFRRPGELQAAGKQLPADADVRLTVRMDIEDRNFHWETRRNSGAEHHFSTHTRTLAETISAGSARIGFSFSPARDRQLRVFAESGEYHPEPEWSENIPHAIEASRGQTGAGDAYSPGWFDLPLAKGTEVVLAATAEPDQDDAFPETAGRDRTSPEMQNFETRLLRAARAFVVRRGEGKTIVAGYPWFLDWGRDTFICARGLLAGGMTDEVHQILRSFARFEKDGTLPNTIRGEDASDRDTSDAPLWFALACEELADARRRISGGKSESLYSEAMGSGGRALREVLLSIAAHYVKGTPNGINMDPDSALIWSPSHFTWMDTNYPAGTPREGYPVEIQALWIRLLRQLAGLTEGPEKNRWQDLAGQALASLEKFFWLETNGYYADLLIAPRGAPAARGVASDALRSNGLLAVSLGLTPSEHARRCVDAALRHLVVPGGLRSLAPLPVSVPLPVRGSDGRLLNNPSEPYWGRYEGDEDTRRKPAYHNGTAWTWTFPIFCEALARAWDWQPAAVAAARAYLGSMDRLMAEGCLGQIPEVLDGDAPHLQRGCDAQAWGVTEALRVWKLLASKPA